MLEEPKQKRPAKRSIFVRTTPAHAASPHVVDLKREEKKEKQVEDVPVFVEKKPVRMKRETIDLAAMVRAANQREHVKEMLNAPQARKATPRAFPAAAPRRKSYVSPVASASLTKKKKKQTKHPRRSTPTFVNPLPRVADAITRPFQTIAAALTPRALVGSVVAVCLLVALPFPVAGYYLMLKSDGQEIVEQSTNAFLALQSSTVAAMQANIPQAQHDLNAALASFGTAQDILDGEMKALVYVMSALPVIGPEVSSRQSLLNAGHHIAVGNTYMMKGVGQAQDDANLSLLAAHIRSSLPQYKQALSELASVDQRVIPAEYQQSYHDFKLLFATLVNDLEDAAALIEAMDTLFGGEDFQRYLVLFQNQHELRATGGFMGSFAIVDVQRGRIVNIEVPGGGTYDVKKHLSEYVEPPLPLQLVNGRWEFQDANWFPHFPATAEKASWFVENSMGTSFDGVIAVNASVVERLLRVVGPIENEEHQVLLTSENVLETLQYKVEVDYDLEENKPKAILADILEQLLANLQDIDHVDLIRLVTESSQALEQKEIQVYSTHRNIQEELGNYGWTGEIETLAPGQDYLHVNFSNLQGQKSDAKMEQSITHQAQVQEDGSVINKVIIKREHTGTLGEQFYGTENIGYLRVLVPEGSELLQAEGFAYPPEDAFHVPEEWYKQDEHVAYFEKEEGVHLESGTRVSTQFGKTAFENWATVAPGESIEMQLVYRLPFRISKQINEEEQQGLEQIFSDIPEGISRYSMVVQKQSGTMSDFSSSVVYPEGWRPQWKTGARVELAENGAVVAQKLDADFVYGIVMEK